MVSFDFYAENDPLVNIIDKRDLKYIERVLAGVHKSLETISRNQQFHIERDETHKNTLEESESHIKWTGIIKIIFLLSSALIQLWIMKGFFKSNEPHAYQPVMTNTQDNLG
jgi:dynactin complex subunit